MLALSLLDLLAQVLHVVLLRAAKQDPALLQQPRDQRPGAVLLERGPKPRAQEVEPLILIPAVRFAREFVAQFLETARSGVLEGHCGSELRPECA